MLPGHHNETFRTVRLNAALMPVRPVEAALCREYGLAPTCVEAHTPEEIISNVAGCDAIFVVSAALPRAVIESLTRCQVISRMGNGTDRIDVGAATERGILVTNVPYFCVEEMADHVMATLLTLVRQIPFASRCLHDGAFARAREECLKLPRVSGLVLGLVGFGASAKAVAARARPFGLKVLATRRRMDVPREEADALGVEMTDLHDVLTRADIVSLHLPLAADTYHLFGRAALRSMKPGAYLINTSRGALVDEDALVECLRDGHLRGAAVDTFEGISIFVENPAAPTHPLTRLDNVILTPHVSGLSTPASAEVARTSVENVVAVRAGCLPHPDHIVNPTVAPRMPLREHDPSLFVARPA